MAACGAGAADCDASGRSPGRRLSGVQASYVVAFHRGLKETGYAEGENLRVEQRWARGNLTQVPALADELIRHNPAVIVTVGGTNIAKAVKATGTAIPIVFALGSDPVEDGLVASMNRPGGNVTGVTFLNNSLSVKRLELVRELVPGATFIAVIDMSALKRRVKITDGAVPELRRTYMICRSGLLTSAILLVFASLVPDQADAGLINVGATVQAFYYNGVFASPEGELDGQYGQY